MSKTIKLIFILTIISFVSCKSDKTNIEQEIKPKEKKEVVQDGSNRGMALATIDHRLIDEPESFSIIESGVWMYKNRFSGGKMSAKGSLDGEWIDYKPDHTYEYGKYDEKWGSGNYHYSMDKEILLMVDDKPEANPEEWEIKSTGDVIIQVGQSTYGSNPQQIQLIREQAIPSR